MTDPQETPEEEQLTDALLHDEKRFNTRFLAIMADPQLRAVVEKFGVEPFRRSSVVESFDEVVRELRFTGKRCVEIGSWMGLTAVVLSRYFDEVVSIDIHPTPVKHEIIDFLGIKNIKFIDVKDNDEKALVFKRLSFDAAYSDGDHAKDAFEDFELVKRCGHVLMHEVWVSQPNVWKLVRRLRDHNQTVEVRDKFGIWRRRGTVEV